MNKLFYITFFMSLVLVTSCISQKKSSKLVLVEIPTLEDPVKLRDSLKQEVSNRYGNYLYYNDGGGFSYIFFKDTASALYKLDKYGIYYYNEPYWGCNCFENLSGTVDILESDSVTTERDNGFFISNARYFTIECKIGDKKYSREIHYYLLKETQPTFYLLVHIERCLLKAEQNKYNWRKIK